MQTQTPLPAAANPSRAQRAGRPPHIGPHLSVAKGYAKAGAAALAIGADTFSIFLRNPRGGSARKFDPDDMAVLAVFLAKHRFAPVVAHAPYTMNLAAEDAHERAFSAEMLAEDLTKMEYLPGNCYNLHPGACKPESGEAGRRAAMRRVADTLNAVLQKGMHSAVLLETMAGAGHELGGTFEELAALLSLIERREVMGVCLDTCHLYAAGYDIKNDLDGVLTRLDRVLGLDTVKAVHLNDCLFELGSHRDRHAPPGEGTIGLAALTRLMLHPALCGLPFILETHGTPAEHGKEIALLRESYAAMTAH